MKNTGKIVIPLLAIFLMTITVSSFAGATDGKELNCAVYFTGVGCPHCAKTDPIILKDKLSEYPNLTIIEYEIYQNRENAPLLEKYSSKFNAGLGIPNIIFSGDNSISGDGPIINNIDEKIKNRDEKTCPLLNGSKIFSKLDLSELPGKPKVWIDEKVLIRTSGKTTSDEDLKELLFNSPENVTDNLEDKRIEPEPVALSGSEVNFKNALQLDGWKLQWERGKTNNNNNGNNSEENKGQMGLLMPLIIVILIVIGIIIGWILKK